MNIGEMDFWMLIKLAWLRALSEKSHYHINFMIDVTKSANPQIRGWQKGELREILDEYYPDRRSYEKLYDFTRWLG